MNQRALLSRSPWLFGLAGCVLQLALLGGACAQSAPAAVRVDAAPVGGESETTNMAKKLQNPIGDLISVPFQFNSNFNTGPNKGTQFNLNIQPVIPIHLNKDWNIITRTILPLLWQPSLQPAHTVPFGTGATSFSAILAPSTLSNGWLWGVGPVMQVPTASDRTLGSPVWGGGPTAVLVYMHGPWVTGVLANSIWSFGGTPGHGGTAYNSLLIQPFVNYNLSDGWYVSTGPLVTAVWPALGNRAWTVPVGAGLGKVVMLGGKLPVNLSSSAYYNVVRPQYGATWQFRVQATATF